MADGSGRPDPRCPSCDGKISATARWCMHCGADFERPVDASGTVTAARETDDGARSRSPDVETGIGESRSGTEDGWSEGTPASGTGVTARLVDYVGASESRRQAAAVTIALAVWLVTGGSAFPPLPLVGALVLCAYLYTRETARATLAAGAAGAGLLVAGLALVGVTLAIVAGGAAPAGALASAVGPVLAGLALVAVGAWLRHG